MYEGIAGTTAAVFTVSLSAASVRAVQAQYATSDGTATGGQDYLAASGTLTFPPGSTAQTVSISVVGDGSAESNKQFLVTVSAPGPGHAGRQPGPRHHPQRRCGAADVGRSLRPARRGADGALFNPSTGRWTFRDSNTGAFSSYGPFGFGSDHFVPADYTGDGRTDCALYRPAEGNW